MKLIDFLFKNIIMVMNSIQPDYKRLYTQHTNTSKDIQHVLSTKKIEVDKVTLSHIRVYVV